MFNIRRTRSRRRDKTPSLARHILTGVGALVFIGLVLAAVWHTTRIPTLSIAEVNVTGGETIAHDAIEREVEIVLRGDYLKLIPHRFTLLYPHDAIAAAVASQPRVKDVSVDRDKRKIKVSFTEYEPYALWCGSGEGAGECYFVDAYGYAFADAPALEGGTLIRHTFDEYATPEKRQLMSTEAFARVHAFFDRLTNDLHLRVTDVRHTKEGDLELQVNGGGALLLRDDGSYDVAFENLRSVLASKEFEHIEPGNFQYIDLRFGNKIFVNESLEPLDSGTTTDAVGTTTPE